MIQFPKRLRKLEKYILQFANDIKILRRLYALDDYQGQLNKIRYIAEGVLRNVCLEHQLELNNKPTLGDMLKKIDKSSEKILPASTLAHFRSIQHNCNPGSHYQEDEDQLTKSHTQIALLALIEILEWYAPPPPPQPISPVLKWSIPFVLISFFFLGAWFWYTPKDHPANKRISADNALRSFQEQFSKRHFASVQLLLALRSNAKPSYKQKDIDEKLEEYRPILREYNQERLVNIVEVDRLYGKEISFWEKEIHLELYYANKNIECLIRGSGDPKKLLSNADQHLQNAQLAFGTFLPFLHRLLDKEEAWPVPITRVEPFVDGKLGTPCSH